MKPSNDNYFTTETSIISAFETLTSDHFDKRTLRVWLNYFKKCMYYASADDSNPAFSAFAYDAIKKSDQYPREFLYIHKLMYRFLCLGNDIALDFAPFTDFVSTYEFTSFKWHVPSHMMPFLISYIKAANNFKKNNPIISFFDELKQTLMCMTFQNTSEKNKYLDLINRTLCRDYFCTLDEICRTFAKNTEQTKILWHCTVSLSQALIKTMPDNHSISDKIYFLLTVFRKKLYAQAGLSKNKKLDLSSLYPHPEPWHIHGETALMENIKKEVTSFQKKLLSFIAENLDTNTPYHIAAKNYETFSEGCAALLDELKQQIENLQKNIFCFYFDVIHTPAIQNAIERGSLTTDYKKLYSCRDLLCQSLWIYFNSISGEMNSFKQIVKKASQTCPEQYKSLVLEKNYFSEFKQSVKSLLDKLYGKNFMLNFNSCRPFLFYNHQGFINDLTYPNMLNCKDCLRLIYEFTGLKYPLSENYIIQYFFTQKIRLPISLAVFLSKIDDILADLNLTCDVADKRCT